MKKTEKITSVIGNTFQDDKGNASSRRMFSGFVLLIWGFGFVYHTISTGIVPSFDLADFGLLSTLIGGGALAKFVENAKGKIL